MMLFKGAIDRIATRLSEFRNPDIPELVLEDEKTLQNNMLECILGVFSGSENTEIRFLMTNLVRRVHASVDAYRAGRSYALEYVAGGPDQAITPYFRALACFEACIGSSWQICDILNHVAPDKKVFERGDGSEFERLNSIHTYGSKHSSELYDAVVHGEMPTSIWLTNSGIDCVAGASLAYRELMEIILSGNQLFYDVQTRAHEKRRAVKRVVDGSGV